MNNIANYIDDDKTEMVMIMMVMIATMELMNSIQMMYSKMEEV